MSLKPGDVANFETLKRAFAEGNAALLECTDAKTGEYRAVLCAVQRDGDDFLMIPFGNLCTTNPFDEYKPPSEGEQ